MNLPEQFIIHYFRSDQIWRWTPPAISDFAGPADLANVMIAYRAKLIEIKMEAGSAPESVGDLSDECLIKLLIVAYRASFLTEESRPVRACLYAPAREESEADHTNETDENPILRALAKEMAEHIAQYARRERKAGTNSYHLLNPLVLDQPKQIARLAPTLVSDDAVLVVADQSSQLVCTGSALLDYQDSNNNLLRPPRGWQGIGGLFVDILGPGEMRVREGHGEYTLRAGEIRIYNSVGEVAPVRDWLTGLAKSLLDSNSADPDWNAEHVGDPDIAYIDLMSLWSRVLRETVRLRHGGAFIVVPDVETSPIFLKYRLQPFSLAEELGRLWLCLCRVWRHISDKQAIDRAEEKRCQTHKMCAAAQSIGHLSATDGCVVLDRNLTLHGFGGTIKTQNEGLSKKRCFRVDNHQNHEVNEEDLLRDFGHRHSSAFNLCKQIPSAMAFVISQDGDLRLFTSDASSIYFYDLLHP
jgi:hypothetical protein